MILLSFDAYRFAVFLAIFRYFIIVLTINLIIAIPEILTCIKIMNSFTLFPLAIYIDELLLRRVFIEKRMIIFTIIGHIVSLK